MCTGFSDSMFHVADTPFDSSFTRKASSFAALEWSLVDSGSGRYSESGLPDWFPPVALAHRSMEACVWSACRGSSLALHSNTNHRPDGWIAHLYRTGLEKQVLVSHRAIALFFDYVGGAGFHSVPTLLEFIGVPILTKK